MLEYNNFLSEVLTFWDKLKPSEQKMLANSIITRRYRQGEKKVFAGSVP